MTTGYTWYDPGGIPHVIPVNYPKPSAPPPDPQPEPVPQVPAGTPPIAPAPSPIDPQEFAAILFDKQIPIGLSTQAQWGGRIIEGPIFGTIGGENCASFVVGFYVTINYWDTTTRRVTELYFRGKLAWTYAGGSL